MKLDDKTIEQITATLTAEIAEEEAIAAKAAASAEGTNSDKPAAEPIEPSETDEQTGTVSRDTSMLDVEALLEEIQHMTDEIPEDEDDTPADDDAPEVEAAPADDVAEPDTETVPSANELDNPEAVQEENPVAEVKSSKAKDILGPVLFILALIAITVLSVACVNLLDKSLQNSKPVVPADIPQSNLAASLQTYTANQVFANEGIQQYTLEQIYAMDLRTPSGATEADLKQVTRAGLVGLEDTFLEAEEKYGVNAIFLISIASVESGYGTQMYRPNNMFGYGGKSYPSKEACIMDVAQGLSSRYLQPGASLYGGSPTLSGVNKRYAANPQWDTKVGKYMKSYYDIIAPYHNQTLQKIQ